MLSFIWIIITEYSSLVEMDMYSIQYHIVGVAQHWVDHMNTFKSKLNISNKMIKYQ